MTETTGFVGFPDVKMRPVVVPDLFFTDLLPQIDDLAELKLTLHCIWLLNEKDGQYRYIRGADLREDGTLLRSLNPPDDLRTPQAVLEDALERAVARNTLLRLEIITSDDQTPQAERTTVSERGTTPNTGATQATIQDEEMIDDWYFLNTVKGRQAIAMIRQGRLAELKSAIPAEARLRVKRPIIFTLYEQNIGMLTPLIADQLRDMEKTYSPEWINDAFEIAISRNKRHLRYIQSILIRWEREGRDGDQYEEAERNSGDRQRKYQIPDELSDIIIG